jgi:hypothetical protein
VGFKRPVLTRSGTGGYVRIGSNLELAAGRQLSCLVSVVGVAGCCWLAVAYRFGPRDRAAIGLTLRAWPRAVAADPTGANLVRFGLRGRGGACCRVPPDSYVSRLAISVHPRFVCILFSHQPSPTPWMGSWPSSWLVSLLSPRGCLCSFLGKIFPPGGVCFCLGAWMIYSWPTGD